jgi:hypothetical protein
MTKPTNDYRLVVFDTPDDPAPLRDLLRGVLGLHAADAMQLVARAPGIWPRQLAEGEVRELLDGMFELQIAAEAWRVDQLPKLAPAKTVHIVACLPDGLRIGGLHGEPAHWVPWNAVEVVHGARIDTDDQVRPAQAHGWATAVANGLNAIVLRKPTAPRIQRAGRSPRDPVPEVHVVRREPRVAFRFVADQLNFAYLGDRLKQSAQENFPLFLADLCDGATSEGTTAHLTDSTHALLRWTRGDESAEPRMYPSSQAMLDDTTLRLLWAWYRRDREKASQDDFDLASDS